MVTCHHRISSLACHHWNLRSNRRYLRSGRIYLRFDRRCLQSNWGRLRSNPGLLRSNRRCLRSDRRELFCCSFTFSHASVIEVSWVLGGPWPWNSDSTRNFIARTGWKSSENWFWWSWWWFWWSLYSPFLGRNLVFRRFPASFGDEISCRIWISGPGTSQNPGNHQNHQYHQDPPSGFWYWPALYSPFFAA